ncbi:helix-turn-helix domain-containing protein [Acidobacteriota bacterium]
MDKLLTLKDVAKILEIPESTVKIWSSQRKFPVIKLGRLIRVLPDDLAEWIGRNRETSKEERSFRGEQKISSRKRSFDFNKYVSNTKKAEKTV